MQLVAESMTLVVGVRLTRPKLRPLMVTEIPDDVAEFPCAVLEITGASNENILRVVPIVDETVNITETEPEPETGGVQRRTLIVVQLVVKHASLSDNCTVGVVSNDAKLMPLNVIVVDEAEVGAFEEPDEAEITGLSYENLPTRVPTTAETEMALASLVPTT